MPTGDAEDDVSTIVTPREVKDLPLVGRDFANLAYLAPGVKLADSYDPTKNRYAILSVSGNKGRDVNVTVNGVDNKDNTVGGPVMQFPLERSQEFHMSTQRFDAESGRSEGAAINVISPEHPPYSRQWFCRSFGDRSRKTSCSCFLRTYNAVIVRSNRSNNVGDNLAFSGNNTAAQNCFYGFRARSGANPAPAFHSEASKLWRRARSGSGSSVTICGQPSVTCSPKPDRYRIC